MGRSPTVAIRFGFRDRSTNRAKMTVYCAVGTADPYALASALASILAPLSNAVLDRVEFVWSWRIDSPGTPDSESNVRTKILILVTNASDEINALVVPSPGPVWETIGNYAGVRLDLASSAALGISAMLLVEDFRTIDNRALGTAIAAGGLMI